jgi:hypothetical protein
MLPPSVPRIFSGNSSSFRTAKKFLFYAFNNSGFSTDYKFRKPYVFVSSECVMQPWSPNVHCFWRNFHFTPCSAKGNAQMTQDNFCSANKAHYALAHRSYICRRHHHLPRYLNEFGSNLCTIDQRWSTLRLTIWTSYCAFESERRNRYLNAHKRRICKS